jgi:hypothetical protein
MAVRNLNDIHSLIDFVERKELGSYHTPEEKDEVLDAAQKELFKECYLSKEYDAIDVFKVSNLQIASNFNGTVDFPQDFAFFKGIFAGTIADPIEIRQVSEEELPKAIKSHLRKISTLRPIEVPGANGTTIYPAAIYNTLLTYYRTPIRPHFSYTRVGRVITYDPTTSVELEFRDIYLDRVIGKALSFLGVNLSEADIIQFGQIKEKSA